MFLVGDRLEFSEWLQNEMNQRGISQSELGRRAGVGRAVINKAVNQISKPDPETIRAIARGLALPPETVFKAAGILPQGRVDDPLTDEAEYLLSQLPENKRQQALAFIRFLANENTASLNICFP